MPKYVFIHRSLLKAYLYGIIQGNWQATVYEFAMSWTTIGTARTHAHSIYYSV